MHPRSSLQPQTLGAAAPPGSDDGAESQATDVAATPAAGAVGANAEPSDFLRLLRPHHWAKNVFVVAPLVFSESIHNGTALAASGIAFVCFSCWASAVYAFNDLIDAGADRQHPRKRKRPIAAGRITPTAATALSLILVAAGLFLSTQFLPRSVALIGVLYLCNSVAYCLLFRHRVIVDVMTIAIGFILRLLGGCAAIGIEPSSWILVCGFSLAMLLGFGKRRTETQNLSRLGAYRPALVSYNAEKLNILLAIAASVCLLSYILYTVSPETIHLHQTNKLVYTIPFVAYGIFRFVLKVQEGAGDGPVEILLKDPVFLWNGMLWLAAVVVILYLQTHLARLAQWLGL